MKLTMKNGAVAIFISIVIFASGVFWIPLLIPYLLPSNPGMVILSRDIKAQFSLYYSLGIVLAFIPVLVLAVWTLASANSFKKQILSVFIILGSVFCFLLVRKQMLQIGSGQTQTIIYMEDLYFATYAAIGLLVGGTLSYLLLRYRKNSIAAKV